MTKEEGNQIIAEFMGGKWKTVYDQTTPIERFYMPDSHITEPVMDFEIDIRYHTSWDWLMPCIEKIGNLRIKSKASYNPDLRFRIEIVNGYTEITGTKTKIFANSSIEGSMLLATYECVVEFIQWYNKNL